MADHHHYKPSELRNAIEDMSLLSVKDEEKPDVNSRDDLASRIAEALHAEMPTEGMPSREELLEALYEAVKAEKDNCPSLVRDALERLRSFDTFGS